MLQNITCDESTSFTCSNAGSSESSEKVPCDIEASEEVTLTLAVPVFQSLTSGNMFENKSNKDKKDKNKILKPVKEEDTEGVTYSR